MCQVIHTPRVRRLLCVCCVVCCVWDFSSSVYSSLALSGLGWGQQMCCAPVFPCSHTMSQTCTGHQACVMHQTQTKSGTGGGKGRSRGQVIVNLHELRAARGSSHMSHSSEATDGTHTQLLGTHAAWRAPNTPTHSVFVTSAQVPTVRLQGTYPNK